MGRVIYIVIGIALFILGILLFDGNVADKCGNVTTSTLFFIGAVLFFGRSFFSPYTSEQKASAMGCAAAIIIVVLVVYQLTGSFLLDFLFMKKCG